MNYNFELDDTKNEKSHVKVVQHSARWFEWLHRAAIQRITQTRFYHRNVAVAWCQDLLFRLQ